MLEATLKDFKLLFKSLSSFAAYTLSQTKQGSDAAK